jgi:hypothetical protein
MTHAALTPGIGREFDPFLFASIGEGRHGHPVTVMSALAQSNVDPWLEAVGLARLSREKATARLSQLIAALPGSPSAGRPIESIADELVALLPRATVVAPLTRAVPPLLTAAVVSPNLRLGLTAGFVAILVVFYFMIPTSNSPGPGQNGPRFSAGDASAPSVSPVPYQRP